MMLDFSSRHKSRVAYSQVLRPHISLMVLELTPYSLDNGPHLPLIDGNLELSEGLIWV